MNNNHQSGELRLLKDYLKKIGVRELKPATSPFYPGYDPVTLLLDMLDNYSTI